MLYGIKDYFSLFPFQKKNEGKQSWQNAEVNRLMPYLHRSWIRQAPVSIKTISHLPSGVDRYVDSICVKYLAAKVIWFFIFQKSLESWQNTINRLWHFQECFRIFFLLVFYVPGYFEDEFIKKLWQTVKKYTLFLWCANYI